MTAIHLDISLVHATVVDISATEDTATVIQTVDTVTRPGLVVELLLIVACKCTRTVFDIGKGIGAKMYQLVLVLEEAVTDIALLERDIRRTEYGTTLTATVGVTLNGRQTIDKVSCIGFTDNDMCLARDIARRRGTDGTVMIAYAAFPAATIDVTGRTALDISIGTGNELSLFGS